MKHVVAAVAAAGIAVAGCASTNVTPVTQDAFLVSTSAAPACGRQGAQKVALQNAAAETLRRGYDKFIIVGAQSSSDVRIVGVTPTYSVTNVYGQTYGSTFSGVAQTNTFGGDPIYGGSHGQDYAVRMFRYADPLAANAIDARGELGPDWKEKVDRNKAICF
jgi:hypothetical protein